LNINDDAVGIKSIEHAIIDKAWEMDWVQPQPAEVRTGKKIAVVGSGPAGMACAQQLARAGHDVTVFEKNDRVGGLLRYGIPDFKMEKSHIDRRADQMRAEGVTFRTGVVVAEEDTDFGTVNNWSGERISPAQLREQFDAVVLSGGAESPRDLPVPGRELAGVYYAMQFLPQQNKVVAGDVIDDQIKATDKHVVVIGGGDTGSDCVGTSNRHGAASVTQLELMPRPPEQEDGPMVWPYWPLKLRTSSSHEEGCERDWAVTTKSLKSDERGHVRALVAARVEWVRDEASGQMRMQEVPGSEFEMPADLVLLAMGFVSPIAGVLDAFGVNKDGRGNASADTEGARAYFTNVDGVFAAGDMRRGQSLVVWAIREGRQCARAVDEYLMGHSVLPR
ncbi:MAG: glutamate synthase subunit beta, partial [Burkholderiaceae bacterium]